MRAWVSLENRYVANFVFFFFFFFLQNYVMRRRVHRETPIRNIVTDVQHICRGAVTNVPCKHAARNLPNLLILFRYSSIRTKIF